MSKWVYVLDGEISPGGDGEPSSAEYFLNAAYDAHSEDNHADWEIILNCIGGDTETGSAIHDSLYAFSQQGGGPHDVTTRIRGKAYSMAAVIAQAGDYRTVGRLSRWMFHEPTIHVCDASLLETESLVATDRDWLDVVVGRFMKRAKNITEDQFYANITGHDWYLGPDDLLYYGFVDRVE